MSVDAGVGVGALLYGIWNIDGHYRNPNMNKKELTRAKEATENVHIFVTFS